MLLVSTFMMVWYPSSSVSWLCVGMLFCPDGQLLVSMTIIWRFPRALVTLKRSAPLHGKWREREERREVSCCLLTEGLRWQKRSTMRSLPSVMNDSTIGCS